ncbi:MULTISPECIES: ABC transporter substrate-binding protein [unclassified Rubrivivax]|uniref:ABC transporter substrate-binding protein n=1 Tax=unclassified Rubrivivax TaxID=2649762 RepID=UPI0013E9520F|nr:MULTISPECIES: ABC transporter substrate-binding protein [unclassified Rubrivivax]MCC9596713.1 ABC transporter substrate-binding protein [Rubrivivax sp. JA1055]MCC9648870.1 ABC transporter substrate-binding protein [Rubrivivax sp. JA1029]MCD0421029.1 ABC transporter substrate-binding protein [Rubrivivax sp. JA1024]
MKRLVRSAALAACLLATAVAAVAQTPAAAPKTLRYAFPIAETSFDPAAITDLYSRTVVSGIFEAPLEFAFLARPVRMRPNTAAAMPEVSEDFRTFTFRIKPGIYFADDPAFKGRKRELVAEDYVYSIKRHYDPRWKSGNLYLLEGAKLLGLSELRSRAIKERKPFDYDRPVEGLRTLDRYTFQVKLAEPSPRFLYNFADSSFTGALAREVVEFYGDRIGEHPVGTGPFKLGAWKRSSRIELDRNPGYRSVLYDEEAPAGDERLQAVAREFKGRRLPLVDRVQISIVEEPQPRWLSFLNEEQDIAENVPAEFAGVAFPNNELAPNLAKRGVLMLRYPRSDVAVSYFGMEHPVVGGYEPHKVALRRAIALAVDVEREIRLVRGGQAIRAQSPIGPEAWGYDPAYKSEMGDYDPARAKALLDMHGWIDRDGDGWRDQPDGSPLVLEYATQPDQQSRKLNELWKKNMDAIGIRIVFKTAKWPEQLKASRAGKLMMWGVGWSAGQPDGDTFLALGYGPNRGQANHARFDLPAFNTLYEKQALLPDGPERQAAMDAAKKLMIAYMPYKVHAHRIWTDLAHPWVGGYSRNIFVREFWKYVDIDPQAQARRGS